MDQKSGSLIEWVIPMAFVMVTAWVVWQMPSFILDWGGHQDNLAGVFARNDITPNGLSLFGGIADIWDYLALAAMPILLVWGVMTVQRAPMEFEATRPLDRLSIFFGRVTMMLIVLLTSVMMYEVIMRYVFEQPTLWANELSLWIAGFVFLIAGLYAMQQRSHIRIFLLYDVVPRWMQRIFDVLSTSLIVLFAAAMVYGSYGEAITKFNRWETFGTAFDPPLPATLKPMILIIICLVAIQAIINLISDWNAEPQIHSAADDIDEDEIERLRRAVGGE